MLNVGTPELLVILVVALLVLGPTKLPEAMRQAGRAVGELRRMSAGFQAELRDAMQEPVVQEPVIEAPTAAYLAGVEPSDGVPPDGLAPDGLPIDERPTDDTHAADGGNTATPPA